MGQIKNIKLHIVTDIKVIMSYHKFVPEEHGLDPAFKLTQFTKLKG